MNLGDGENGKRWREGAAELVTGLRFEAKVVPGLRGLQITAG